MWFRMMQREGVKLRGHVELLKNVGSFLIDDRLLDNLRRGRAQSRLREIREVAVRKRWKRILVFGGCECPRIRDEFTGLIRPVDTDDEDEMGVLPSSLNYLNRFWRLQLAMHPHYPMNVICDYLYMSALD